ncbi:DUF2946 family protein [Ottowia caeni]|uniref:DUF2946 family protein n=1 Tax=Ottowia caeni TaxID=2870339 RepID=UPI003D73755D
MLSSLSHQRMHHRIARFMLAWFALVLGVAAASPLVNPQAVQMVCSANGSIKLVADTGEELTDTSRAHTLDCALCLLANTPPHASAALPVPPMGVAQVLAPRTPEPVLELLGAPLPARGPPVSLEV